MAAEVTAIQPAPEKIFAVDRTINNIKEWEDAKKRILSKSDVVQVGQNSYIRRTGWRKLGLAANVATSIVDYTTAAEGEWSPANDKGEFTATVKAKAIFSWGRWAEDLGSYSASEFVSKQGKRLPISRHSIIARAATRAINRAISDLIGGGIVTAEEVSYTAEEVDEKATQETKEGAGVAEPTPTGLTKEQVEYEVRDYPNLKVTESGDLFLVQVPSELTGEAFAVLRTRLEGLGAKYVFDRGRKAFQIKK